MKFKIKKGRHHCNWWWIPRLSPIPFGESTWEIKMWGEGLKYDFGHPDQLDINKIFGESYGLNHHNNSFRIGWNTSFKKTNLGERMIFFNVSSYSYIDRYRQSVGLDTLIVSKENNISFKVKIDKNKPFLRVCTDISDDITFIKSPRISWLLKPYFGGNRKATGDIHFEINRIV